MKKLTEKKIKQLKKLLVCNRIKILKLLLERDTCVCEMVDETKLKHSLISHHLKTLIDMGFVKNTRNGQHIIYNLVEEKRKATNEIMDLIEST